MGCAGEGNRRRASPGLSATNALQDPHRIEAKPSLIARARGSQLVVATGADLEIGWLPVVLRESGNAGIQPGQPGYFEAASAVRLIEVPVRLDRADGDVHPGGNPHIQTDPRNVLKVAEALAGRLSRVDPAGAGAYRANLARFSERWKAAMVALGAGCRTLAGRAGVGPAPFLCLLGRLAGLKELGALEPKPGVEPGSAHLAGCWSARRRRRPG
jgi:zinc/manganese transport system substrate-binding protein